MIDRLPGTSRAPPTPCAARAVMSCPTSTARPHQTEAAAKSATPIAKMRRLPYRSPSAPPTSRSAASSSAYDSTIHCASAAVAPNATCSAGNATFTTVPSMKTMLDPRIVAARIHGPSRRSHGAAGGPARMTASSQGGLMATVMVSLSAGRWCRHLARLPQRSVAARGIPRRALRAMICCQIAVAYVPDRSGPLGPSA